MLRGDKVICIIPLSNNITQHSVKKKEERDKRKVSARDASRGGGGRKTEDIGMHWLRVLYIV